MKVYIIGNAALDETFLVPELPEAGASIFARPLARGPGGKGLNQAVVMARAGLSCRLVAPVGEDVEGAEIGSGLAAEALELRLLVQAGIRSDRSVILMAEGGRRENAVITTREAALALSPEAVLQELGAAQPGDLLVMQGNLGEAATLAALACAQARGMARAVNPSPMPEYVARLWTTGGSVFVNEGEAATLGGPAALLAAGAEAVIVTRGARGAVLLREGETIEAAAIPAQVVDTTGAGDCFMATALASAMSREAGLDARALRHGAQAAAYTVGRAGTLNAFPDSAMMARILAV